MENWTEVKIYPWEIFVRWSQERNEKWEEVWAHRTLVIGLCPVSRRQHEDAGIKKVQEVDHKYINEREARERLNSAVIHWSPSTSSTRLIVSRKKNNETRVFENIKCSDHWTRNSVGEYRNSETLRMKTCCCLRRGDEGLSFIRTGFCLPPRFPGNSADLSRWLLITVAGECPGNTRCCWYPMSVPRVSDNHWAVPAPGHSLRCLSVICGWVAKICRRL